MIWALGASPASPLTLYNSPSSSSLFMSAEHETTSIDNSCAAGTSQKYTVIVRDEQFTLHRSQIEFDAPNYFTAYFLGEFRESGCTTLMLDRNPDLFAILIEYMSGYTILPLSSKSLPRTMNPEIALRNLAEDAAFYGLSRLHDKLTRPRPAEINFAWTGFSSRVIMLDDLLTGTVRDVNYTTSGLCAIDHGHAPRPVVIYARGLPVRYAISFAILYMLPSLTYFTHCSDLLGTQTCFARAVPHLTHPLHHIE